MNPAHGQLPARRTRPIDGDVTSYMRLIIDLTDVVSIVFIVDTKSVSALPRLHSLDNSMPIDVISISGM